MDKKRVPLNRRQMFERLKTQEEFDVVVIGGGATGLGVALDAVSRGLTVAVVEAHDWASGTSSRSTKLIHGGVRYLTNPGNWHLIREALYERRLLLQNAPRLVRAQRFVLPCTNKLKMLWYGAGLSLYSLFSSGGRGIHPVAAAGRVSALGMLPGIERKALAGALSYSDAQFDDAGLATALLATAVSYGAVALNYTRMIDAEADGSRVTSVVVQDGETGFKYKIRAKAVFNCAGVWADDIRRLVDVRIEPLLRISRGSHIMVDRSFLPTGNAMIIPKTSDGRVLFCIPWQGRLEIGTTDIEQGQAPFDTQPTQDEIDFLIKNANRYLSRKIRREDVRAAFAGLRPLLGGKNKRRRSADVSREFEVLAEFGNMITVAGGKWTTYRAMAEQAVDKAIRMRLLPKFGCMTRSLPLIDGERMAIDEIQRELLREGALDAATVAKVKAFAENEFKFSGARTAADVLYRRLRIGQLDTARTEELMPVVGQVMDALRKREEKSA